ncbi:(d)CMP kinase [Candidatus Woesearchaeota archaeon]|nr:(d)CMP kinase [Candidatus Woesearchaeota archaeon]
MTQICVPEIVKPDNSKTYESGPICISGPPASGKSTIGRLLAKKLNLDYYDLDELVAQQEGVKTSREVMEKGVRHFQKISHECLKRTFETIGGPFILSFGGGTIIHLEKGDYKDQNLRIVKKNSFVICILPSKSIHESVNALWPRQSDGKRLTGVKSEQELVPYLERRMPGYISTADRIIYTNNSSVEKTISAVLKSLK